nr:substrate-binding domain-containing protein [Stenotrophomonas rhizophila]
MIFNSGSSGSTSTSSSDVTRCSARGMARHKARVHAFLRARVTDRRHRPSYAVFHPSCAGREPVGPQPGYFTYRSGLEAAERLLTLPQPPSAIFASNDDMASAVVSVAHRRGLEVPGDLSVVGFDDTSASTMVWPELTTIHQPVAEMADTAVDILLREIRRSGSSGRVTVNHMLAHQLVTRASVSRPPPAP